MELGHLWHAWSVYRIWWHHRHCGDYPLRGWHCRQSLRLSQGPLCAGWRHLRLFNARRGTRGQSFIICVVNSLVKVSRQVRNCTSDLHVSVVDKLHLEGNALSTIIKLLYAFLWQEEWSFFEGHLDMILDPGCCFFVHVGSTGYLFFFQQSMLWEQTICLWSMGLPIAWTTLSSMTLTCRCMIADALSVQQLTLHPSWQNGTGIYPGDFWCNLENPHSKWHLQSAAGLTDLVFLADDVFRITINDWITHFQWRTYMRRGYNQRWRRKTSQ